MKEEKARSQLIQDIERACRISNPDLLKLEFGCRIALVPPFTEDPWTILYADGNGWVLGRLNETFYISKEDQDIEILGKEPGLADVLLALQNEDKIELFQYGNLLTMGHYEDADSRSGHYDYCHWDLSKNLSGQEGATLQFLHSLLFTK